MLDFGLVDDSLLYIKYEYYYGWGKQGWGRNSKTSKFRRSKSKSKPYIKGSYLYFFHKIETKTSKFRRSKSKIEISTPPLGGRMDDGWLLGKLPQANIWIFCSIEDRWTLCIFWLMYNLRILYWKFFYCSILIYFPHHFNTSTD